MIINLGAGGQEFIDFINDKFGEELEGGNFGFFFKVRQSLEGIDGFEGDWERNGGRAEGTFGSFGNFGGGWGGKLDD